MTTHEPHVPEGVDRHRPSSARMYDYYLGGSHNFTADREAAEQVLSFAWWTRDMARSNRSFLRRVVTYLVREAGIHQFLDLGSGVPTVGNVHEVAQAIDPSCQVVYVDMDAVAVAHSRLLLATNPRATVIQADIRQPARIQEHWEYRSTLDLTQPVAVLTLSVLVFIRPEDNPAALVTNYLAGLVPGSYLAVLHASLEGAAPDLATKAREAAEIYARAGAPVTPDRGRAEILGWFAGLELVEPGVVPLMDWRPDAAAEHEFRRMVAYGGVGRVVTAE